MMWFRCVINHVSDVFLITRVTWLERSVTTTFVRVLRFIVLIDLNVCSITYHLFAYVIINAEKIIGLPA